MAKRKPTRRDLIRRAIDAVDKEEEIAFDVAADAGLMFDDVKNQAAFVADVANELIDSMDKWAHVEYVTPSDVRRFYR
ncbi:MAG: hypothetical protein ACREDF_09540 [Thermoplasmata archaeon]